MRAGGKIPTSGGDGLAQNPFGALSKAGLPSFAKASASDKATADQPEGAVLPTKQGAPPEKNRGRVDVRRETGNRGGKTVTVIDGFTGIGPPEKEQLAKKMRAACGCGGTVKDGAIEIQGDQRATVVRILTEAGFRPVMAGG